MMDIDRNFKKKRQMNHVFVYCKIDHESYYLVKLKYSRKSFF